MVASSPLATCSSCDVKVPLASAVAMEDAKLPLREIAHGVSTRTVKVPDSTISMPPDGSLASRGSAAPGWMRKRAAIISAGLGSVSPELMAMGSNVTPSGSIIPPAAGDASLGDGDRLRMRREDPQQHDGNYGYQNTESTHGRPPD